MQYDRVQCNIAELYVYIVLKHAELYFYIVLKLQLSCVLASRCEAVCLLDYDAISKP